MSLTEKPELPAAVPSWSTAVLDTLVPSFPAGAVDELRSQVHGPVYAAGDDGLAAEVATWNVAVQHTPAIAVGATCAADVAAAVSWAVAHDLRVAVQATGHGPVRNAAGSLMITTRRMQGLSIDPERRDRPRRGRREVGPRHGGRRRVRPGRAVRVVVRRRRRGLHARRRHGLARPQVRLRRRPRPGGRDRHRRRAAAPGLRRLRARAVLGGPRRQGQLRHRHRARDRAGARAPRCSAAASSSPATTPPPCCTGSASGRRRCPRRSAPRSRSSGCPTWRSCRRRCAGRPSSTCGTPTPATTTPRPSACSRR